MQHAKPMSDSVVRRWKDAGAVIGWIDHWGFFSETKSEDDDLPAFLFESDNGRADKLDGLLDPGIPFGLQLGDETDDTDLKHIVPLKSLKLLTLGMTRVTDHGVKELVTLSNLQTLHLS